VLFESKKAGRERRKTVAATLTAANSTPRPMTMRTTCSGSRASPSATLGCRSTSVMPRSRPRS